MSAELFVGVCSTSTATRYKVCLIDADGRLVSIIPEALPVRMGRDAAVERGTDPVGLARRRRHRRLERDSTVGVGLKRRSGNAPRDAELSGASVIGTVPSLIVRKRAQ